MAYYAPGSIIADHYEIASQPLLGGMGIVYLCIDRLTDKPVALKTFKPEFLPNNEARSLFLKEGTTWVSIGQHSNIVQCYEVEYAEHGLEIYLVLELIAKVEGYKDASMRALLTSGKSFTIEESLFHALQVARGMRHVCSILPGFFHRDLKPENLLIGADFLPGTSIPRLRVTDFGLAGILQNSGIVTQGIQEGSPQAIFHTRLINGVAGTPQYMAPDQWNGTGNVQTDIFALGAILYEMLCGKCAIPGSTLSELRSNCLAGNLNSIPANLPDSLSRFLASCLAINPKKRLSCWEQVVQEIEKITSTLVAQELPVSDSQIELESADHIRLGWTYNSIGMSYKDISKYDYAKHFFDRVQSIGLEEENLDLLATSLGNLANIYVSQNDYSQAIEYYKQHLAIAREIGDQVRIGAAIGNLGIAYRYLGDYQQAKLFQEQSLQIAKQIGDLKGEGAALGNLGNLYAALSDYPHAIEYQEQHLSIARKIGDRHGEGIALGNLGNTYDCLGDYQSALKHFQQSLEIARLIGDRQSEANNLGNIGLVLSHLSEYQRAISYHERCLEKYREIGDQKGEGAALGNLGNVYENLGEYQRTIEYNNRHLVIARMIGDRQGEAEALGNLGVAHSRLGNFSEAIQFFEQALSIFLQIGDHQGEGSAIGNLGNVYCSLGEYSRAIQYFEQRLDIARRIGDRHGEGSTLGNLGIAYNNIGNYPLAIRYLEQRLIIAQAIGDKQGEGSALGNIGLTYNSLLDYKRAINYFKKSLAISRKLGDKAGIAGTCFNYAISLCCLEQLDRALPLAKEAATLFEEISSPLAARARQLLAQLQIGLSPAAPSTDEVLREFEDIIQAVVDASHRNAKARQALEAFFPQLEQNGWHITGPIQQIWAGERNETRLMKGLDEKEILIISEILCRLQGQDNLFQLSPYMRILIQAAVDAVHGNQVAHQELEMFFPKLEENNLHITEPIRRIWAGERSKEILTQGLDGVEALIIYQILQQLN